MRVAKMPYLQWVNGIARVRVVVPDALVPLVGKGNLVRSTGTGNEREANRIATQIVAEFLERIDEADAKLRGEQTFRQMVEAKSVDLLAWHDRKVAEARQLLEHADAIRTEVTAWINALRPEDLPPDEKVTPASNEVQPYEPVVELWALKKNKLSRARDRRMSKMKRLFDFFGHNDMRRVTPADLARYEEESLLAMVTAGEWKYPTVRDHLIDIKAIFRFAKEQQKIDSNPAADLRTYEPDVADDRDEIEDFSKTEVERILLAAAASDDPVVKWGNWLGAHYGARVAEIVEAQTTDIYDDDETGIPVFDIRLKNRPRTQRVKTGFSARRLPVPAAVVRLGFLDYVAEVRQRHGDGPLFPMLRADKHGRLNTEGSRVLMEWLRGTAKIESPLKRFHSWRHTTATTLENRGVSTVRARKIVGHAPRNRAERYIHHSLEELQKAINLLPDPPAITTACKAQREAELPGCKRAVSADYDKQPQVHPLIR